jgi:dihydroorotate dehydrogenase (NAD+) catalytic subunit
VSVRIGSLELEHAVLNASGTLDPLAAEAAGLAICRELAAVVTKTVTPFAREGNAAPRIAEVSGGMINSIGLQNPGIDSFCDDVLPLVAALGRPVVVSIGGFSLGDYADLAEQLDGCAGVVALELNISCPNVETGCISIGSDTGETEAVVRAVRERTRLPIWVKLSPNVPDIAAIARAAEAGGAGAVVCVNTLRGLVLDRVTREPLLGGGTGGLSGPLLKPVALAAVAACSAAVAIPVIGVGGISCADDARDFLACGAVAVQVGSAAFAESDLAARIRHALGS